MAPTALDKAVQERGLLQRKVDVLDVQLAATVAVVHAVDDLDIISESAEKAFTDLENLQLKIVTLFPANLDDHTAEYMKLYTQLCLTRTNVRKAKRALIAAIPIVSPNGPKTTEIRLPRMELPTFYGSFKDWMPYRDQFVSAVHNNSVYSKSQKLNYLKSTLAGEAARLVSCLAITDDNFDIAWAQLTERYENERELVITIVSRFLDQPPVQGTAAQLRTLVDTTKECLSSLKCLKLPVEEWDAIIFVILLRKLDCDSRQLWAQSLKDTSVPILKDFIGFLEIRASALAAGSLSTSKPSPRPEQQVPPKGQNRVHHAQSQQPPSPGCKVCSNGNHPLFKCGTFMSMPVSERADAVKKAGLCFNCMKPGHGVAACTNEGTCHKCNAKHHTLLHREQAPVNPNPLTLSHHATDGNRPYQTVLATAAVLVQDSMGHFHSYRALLDSGSTDTFITEACSKRLRLAKSPSSAEVMGLSATPCAPAKGQVTFSFKSRLPGGQSYTVQALVLSKITGNLPFSQLHPNQWPYMDGISLADPEFHRPGPIDILLGADIFFQLLTNGRKNGGPNTPTATNSKLGWLISGKVEASSQQVMVHHASASLDMQLEKFWELETLTPERSLTTEEQACENHFDLTHTRTNQGRFSVSLPFKTPRLPLGPSRDIAVRRLLSLEKRLTASPQHYNEYREFMREYLQLEHMKKIPQDEVERLPAASCYIPHHYVLKLSSTTTKFRVVFDASAHTGNGQSLNETMMVGRVIQDSLITILTRFRKHPIAFTADIAKMYRQILVSEIDQDMQRIVWRESPDQPLEDFRLRTVTYGTGPAPYLATRSLQQLARNEQIDYPLASKVAQEDFYVDDCLSGTSTLQQAISTQAQLMELMKRGQMDLRKWVSNSPELLATIPMELRGTKENFSLDVDQTVKTLGIFWNPVRDEFGFKISLTEFTTENKLTKRKLLSEIAKIFDPLGWLGPTIIRAKIMMQDLWKLKLDWDDLLPESVQQEWFNYRDNLPSIEDIVIPRCVVPTGYTSIYLAGFCDASEKAFAAVVYLCAYGESKVPHISLISSKTRVAPTKQVSLPRLELCGALLLAQLLTQVQESLKLPIKEVQAWSDSTVVLAWISAHPSRWKTFVANRVTEIQEKLPASQWSHVSAVENPADCASRGMGANEPSWSHFT